MQRTFMIEVGKYAGAKVEVWWAGADMLLADLWMPGDSIAIRSWVIHNFAPERARQFLAARLSDHLGIVMDENDLP